MAEYKIKENTGNSFKNKKKEAEDKRPHYNGVINIKGKEYYLNTWIKENKNKEKYLSHAINEKGEKKQEPKEVNQSEIDNEIPF